jgi:hypothetical protein
MDIYAYDYILEGLKAHNVKAKNNYGNAVVSRPTTDTKYPFTVLTEVTNTQNPRYNTPHERVANVSYRVDIFAKDKGTKVDKQTIAREISLIVDEYLTNIGLFRSSMNVVNLLNDASIYRISLTYEGSLFENRRTFL